MTVLDDCSGVGLEDLMAGVLRNHGDEPGRGAERTAAGGRNVLTGEVGDGTRQWFGSTPSRAGCRVSPGSVGEDFPETGRDDLTPDLLVGFECCQRPREDLIRDTVDADGHDPEAVHTTADGHIEMRDDDGPTITRIELTTDAAVPEISESEFQDIAEDAKTNCPVSRALSGVEIELDASLDI